MELGPVDVAPDLAGRPRVEPAGRLHRAEVELGVVPRGAERADLARVLGAQEPAERGDRVGVVVLIVEAVAKVEGALVVDLHEDDGPLGPAQGRQLLADRAVPAGRLVEERRARVARHGERDRHHRQHDGVSARGARLALGAPHDALRQAEVGELRVDVRAGPQHAPQPDLVRHPQERAHVEARVERSRKSSCPSGASWTPHGT